MQPLDRRFYESDPASVARSLLGTLIARRENGQWLVARIVETEAYFGPGDPASHARTRTPRSEIMYGRAGFAYVYLNYGVHSLLNVVADKEEVPGAVLIRAVEPLQGIKRMRARRPVERTTDLTRGPGRLTEALGIDLTHNGTDLTGRDLFISEGSHEGEVVARPRIGLSGDSGRLLRFYVGGSKFVSKE